MLIFVHANISIRLSKRTLDRQQTVQSMFSPPSQWQAVSRRAASVTRREGRTSGRSALIPPLTRTPRRASGRARRDARQLARYICAAIYSIYAIQASKWRASVALMCFWRWLLHGR